jgi:hypothetical protein
VGFRFPPEVIVPADTATQEFGEETGLSVETGAILGVQSLWIEAADSVLGVDSHWL